MLAGIGGSSTLAGMGVGGRRAARLVGASAAHRRTCMLVFICHGWCGFFVGFCLGNLYDWIGVGIAVIDDD